MALSTNRTLITQTGINTHQVLNVGGLDSAGIATFSNFKTGTTNVHNVGIELAGINVLGGDTPIGTGATIFRDGGANFSGIVSATTFSGAFTGDGQNLTGLPAGLGTALSNTQTLALNKVYYTDRVLSISTTTTVDPPASASIAYTQYTDIKIEDGHDLIIKDGDELRPDVLGLSTTKTLDTNNFPDGLRGNLIGNVTGDATGLSGNPSINTTGIITATAFIPSQGQLSHRNKVHNGDMRISQRYGTTAHTPSSTTRNYVIDRWGYWSNQASKTSIQQVTDAPVGFKHSAKCTSLSAHTAAAGHWFGYLTTIEAQDIYDLEQGTANAKSFTLSFYVKSSIKGTWAAAVRTKPGSPSRSYPFNYTINSQNTWERKTITIPGSTDGTWLTDNNEGMTIWFDLGTGSTFHATANQWYSGNAVGPSASPFIAVNGATWLVTGVQLEVGSVATPFEHRSISDELLRCNRYYQKYSSLTTGYGSANGYARSTHILSPEMRDTPDITVTIVPGEAGSLNSTQRDSKHLEVTWQSLNGVQTGDFDAILDAEF